ncbi:unnamed protein product [Linum trigynum]|uniref:Uncharacterized protein n=1 Tax=Linum trigynum TaxID=586398 RepID=A0AAV2FQT3_9ROSI
MLRPIVQTFTENGTRTTITILSLVKAINNDLSITLESNQRQTLLNAPQDRLSKDQEFHQHVVTHPGEMNGCSPHDHPSWSRRTIPPAAWEPCLVAPSHLQTTVPEEVGGTPPTPANGARIIFSYVKQSTRAIGAGIVSIELGSQTVCHKKTTQLRDFHTRYSTATIAITWCGFWMRANSFLRNRGNV